MKHTKKLLSLLLVLCLILSLSCTAFAADEAKPLTGKTVIPFCTSSSSGLGQCGELLAELAGTGDWLEGQRFRSGVSQEDVNEWVDSLGLSAE